MSTRSHLSRQTKILAGFFALSLKNVSFGCGIIDNHRMTDDDDTLYICADCIGETYLSDKVRRECQEHECHYCGDVVEAISLEELADEIEAAFNTHYTRTAQDPDSFQLMMLKDKEIDYEWDREGEEAVYAIMNAAELPEDAAKIGRAHV